AVLEPGRVEHAGLTHDPGVGEPAHLGGQGGHLVERVRHHDEDGVGRAGGQLAGDVADDLGVDLQQVHAAHAGLAGQAGGDHADVGAGGGVIGVAADDAGLEALDRPALHHVQGQALRLVLDDVDHHDLVDDVGFGDAQGGGGAVE